MTTEIERKFLVDGLPPSAVDCPHDELAQGYLAVGGDGTEVRLRRRGATFWQTVKRGAGLMRTEVEIELDRSQFEALWPLTVGRRLEKTRYRIAYGEATLELDVYRGPLSGLYTVEVEFDSVQASAAFSPPEWFGAEITEDTRYSNRNLAEFGLSVLDG